jgi:hypothetical protein
MLGIAGGTVDVTGDGELTIRDFTFNIRIYPLVN